MERAYSWHKCKDRGELTRTIMRLDLLSYLVRRKAGHRQGFLHNENPSSWDHPKSRLLLGAILLAKMWLHFPCAYAQDVPLEVEEPDRVVTHSGCLDWDQRIAIYRIAMNGKKTVRNLNILEFRRIKALHPSKMDDKRFINLMITLQRQLEGSPEMRDYPRLKLKKDGSFFFLFRGRPKYSRSEHYHETLQRLFPYHYEECKEY